MPSPTALPIEPEQPNAAKLQNPISIAGVTLERDWLIVGIVFLAAIIVAFFPLLRHVTDLWFGDDTYYAHGSVVPICSALIAWERWPKLKQTQPKPVSWVILPAIGVMYISWFARRTDMHTAQALLLLAILMLVVLFTVGWKWLWHLTPVILYLAFCLPIYDRFIDAFTTPLQTASTDGSFELLKLIGQQPIRQDVSTILLNQFTLDVGIACSGMKLLLAVIAISVFFTLVAKLKWWGNVVLIAAIVPLALLVNSLRITFIGIVGNTYGAEAGHKFHDYSGYISLVICFLLLMKLTKVLGWK